VKPTAVYVKRARIDGEPYVLCAVEGVTRLDGGGVRREGPYLLVASPGEGPPWLERVASVVHLLPDEQSFRTLFPLDVLLGRRRRVSRLLDEEARRLRLARTDVRCFHPGCREQARFRAVPPGGLGDGCWFACGPDHFADATTKGVPLTPEDFEGFREDGATPGG
jgi:hypothetical protein